MPYGEITHVRAPAEAYAAMHQQIAELLGDVVPDGVILHVARATEDGFEVFEVWESKEQADAFNRDILPRAMANLGADASGPPPEVVEFEPLTATTFRAFDFQGTTPQPAGSP